MKRLFIFMMVFMSVICFSAVGSITMTGVSATAEIVSGDTMTEGEKILLKYTSRDEQYLRFIPDEDAVYSFSLKAVFNVPKDECDVYDVYATVYDDSGKKIGFNDDWGEVSESFVMAGLQKGKTYYLGAKFHGEPDSGENADNTVYSDIEASCKKEDIDLTDMITDNYVHISGKTDLVRYTGDVIDIWSSGDVLLISNYQEDNDIFIDGIVKKEIYYAKADSMWPEYDELEWTVDKPREMGIYAMKVMITEPAAIEIYQSMKVGDIYDINNLCDVDGEQYFRYTGSQIDEEKLNKPINVDDEYLEKDVDYVHSGYIEKSKYTGSTEDSWTEGYPSETGTYYVRYEGIGKYKGTALIKVIIPDEYDLEYFYCNNPESLHYPFDKISETTMVCEYYDCGGEVFLDKSLNYGTDFTYAGYCLEEEYEKNKENAIFINGFPGVEGEYVYRFSGLSPMKGYAYVEYYIDSFEVGRVSIKEFNAESMEITLKENEMVYYKIVPTETDLYTIYSEYADQYDPVAYLYNNKGVAIADNDDKIEDSGEVDRNFSMSAMLKAGETYYIGVKNISDNDNASGKVFIKGSKEKYVFMASADENKTPTPAMTVPTPAATADGKSVTGFTKGNLKYKVNKSSAGKLTVSVSGGKNKKIKTANIPADVKYSGKTYTVTAVSNSAFSNYKKLNKVIIGKNISKIGEKAFKGCGKLKSIKIKTKKLKKSSIGKNVFKGINKKSKIKYPAGYEKKYKKLIKK